MASITIRIDDAVKVQLQELVTELGLDITTFFTIAAKQAIREQRIPFKITANVPDVSTEPVQEKSETPTSSIEDTLCFTKD